MTSYTPWNAAWHRCNPHAMHCTHIHIALARVATEALEKLLASWAGVGAVDPLSGDDSLGNQALNHGLGHGA